MAVSRGGARLFTLPTVGHRCEGAGVHHYRVEKPALRSEGAPTNRHIEREQIGLIWFNIWVIYGL